MPRGPYQRPGAGPDVIDGDAKMGTDEWRVRAGSTRGGPYRTLALDPNVSDADEY